jgi:hypothetical protein
MMDLRRPYRPCAPVPFRPDRWLMLAAGIASVAVEIVLGGWLVLAFAGGNW